MLRDWRSSRKTGSYSSSSSSSSSALRRSHFARLNSNLRRLPQHQTSWSIHFRSHTNSDKTFLIYTHYVVIKGVPLDTIPLLRISMRSHDETVTQWLEIPDIFSRKYSSSNSLFFGEQEISFVVFLLNSLLLVVHFLS